MKQSIKLDIICISKVLRYIKLIGKTYTMCGVTKKEDLLDFRVVFDRTMQLLNKQAVLRDVRWIYNAKGA